MTKADIVVIGAGPAGMAASIRAQDNGATVLVIDDNPEVGGQIWRGGQRAHPAGQSADWFRRLTASSVPVLAGAQVVSVTASTKTALVETWDKSFEVRYKRLIIAAGAREIFLPFPGWTLPGVTGVGGLQALVKSGLPMHGKSVVIAGSGPLLLAVAASLRKSGAHVKLIAEQACSQSVTRFAFGLIRHAGKLTQAVALRASLLGIPYHYGCWIEKAEGQERLERVRLQQDKRRWTEQCDYAAVAYGLYPNLELPSLLNCRIQNDVVIVDDFGRTSVDDIYCVGECTGIGGVDLSLLKGEIAGYSASGQHDRAKRLFAARTKARNFANSLNIAFALRDDLKTLPKDDTFVCRCEDVSYGRLKSFSSFRAAKLHTRCGMGPCQGRVCGPATQFLFGWRAESIRPPIFPTRLGSLVIDEAVPEEAAPVPQ